jgi:hypothetical protein
MGPNAFVDQTPVSLRTKCNRAWRYQVHNTSRLWLLGIFAVAPDLGAKFEVGPVKRL